jgi:signal transduction histidine kinase
VEASGGEAQPERLIEVARALVSDTDLDTTLSKVVSAAIEITGARYGALGVLDEERAGLERFVHHGIDEALVAAIGHLPRGRGVLGLLIEDPRPLRVDDIGGHPRAHGFPAGHPPMRTFLGVPIEIGGEPWGNLYLTEKEDGAPFDEADERNVVTLAGWAAIAIANARSVAAAEHERRQWARELHDETLQGLAFLRFTLGSTRDDPQRLREVAPRMLEQIDLEITNLRALISDLRPDLLDETGVEAALEAMTQRMARRSDGVRIELEASRFGRERLKAPLEIAIYRVVQEAITNAIRHGGAKQISVRLRRSKGWVEATVTDDGSGFDPDDVAPGFGLQGMRERAELARGELEIESEPGRGARIRLRLPLIRAEG